MTETTSGHLLGGRVRHDQFRHGHRTGIEPVLLAASIPARAGDHVLEGGTGSGAALMCLAARVPEITGVGIERDPALAELARRNIAANAMPGLVVAASDIAGPLDDVRAFDHAFANPPWHNPAGTPSPDRLKETAKRGAPGLIGKWAMCLGGRLRARGTLTFVLPVAAIPEALSAWEQAEIGSAVLLPFWPHEGSEPKLVLLRGIKGGRGTFRLRPGLVLHTAEGRFTPAAQAIFTEGGALRMDA
jgi:tRNA1(Val) A37 N6-methylase TrmN6